MLKSIVNKIDHIGKSNDKKKEYFFYFTLFFIIAAISVFSWYFFAGRTLINQGDGWNQHYKALIYYTRYMREIIKNILFEHQFVLPLWDFNIGEGSGIIETLHYYVIGDPFSLFSVFVPVRFMYIYYNIMMLLRLYFAGIAFSFLCFETGIKSRFAVMAGSLTYCFCFFAIYNATRHPFFLNPMLYLPLIILGIEKILKKKRPYFYILTIFIATISHFYNFYMLVLITVIYVSVRMITSYRKNIQEGFLLLFRIAIFSILGVCMGAFLFLPVCYTFLGDSRFSSGNSFHLFYPLLHYSRLPALFISEGDSYLMDMGFSAPTLLAVFLLFIRRNKYNLLKYFFVIGIIIMSVPFLGQVLNGFSYAANRWCWAFALLSSYMLAAAWTSLMKIDKKEAQILLMCTIGYLAICFMLEYSRTAKIFAAISIVLIFLFLISPCCNAIKITRKQQFALLLVFISILNTSFWRNAAGGGNYASEGVEVRKAANEWRINETNAIKEISKKDGTDSFYRFSGRNLTTNANILAKISSTQFYWSLSNPYISAFRDAMQLRENRTYNYEGYDDRTALTTLAAVKYYVTPADQFTPPSMDSASLILSI